MPPDDGETLDKQAWDGLWASFTTSAWRLEARPVYRVGSEDADVARFLATGDVGDNSAWHARIRRYRAAGCTVGRVHVFSPPLTDYLRYEFAAYAGNVEAGEDVRLLDLSCQPNPGLPDEDFWIFDDHTVVEMNYSDDGALASRVVVPSVEVSRYLEYRRIALVSSTPLAEYQESRRE